MNTYFNPNTQEKKSRDELKLLYNISFPEDLELLEMDNQKWHLLHQGVYPDFYNGQTVVPSTIELIDGHYTQTYDVIGEPQAVEQSIPDRLTDIEDMLKHIRNTQEDLEQLSENETPVSERLNDLENAIIEIAEILMEKENG